MSLPELIGAAVKKFEEANYSDAISLYNVALEVMPTSLEALVGLGAAACRSH